MLNTKWQTTFYSICPKWLQLHHCHLNNDAIEAISAQCRLNKMWSAIWYSAHLIASNIFIGLIKSTKKSRNINISIITYHDKHIRNSSASSPQATTNNPVTHENCGNIIQPILTELFSGPT